MDDLVLLFPQNEREKLLQLWEIDFVRKTLKLRKYKDQKM